MLLTLTTTHRPATDLGYLLHKHPGRFQSYDLSFGKAHVFYPEASDDRLPEWGESPFFSVTVSKETTLSELLTHLYVLIPVFEFARPGTVVLTTPDREYNVMWENVGAGKLRHADHRFEWTRDEFRAWAEGVAGRHGYSVRFLAIGPVDEVLGPPTQMAVFGREGMAHG
jgi:hypothetical protein